MSVSAHGPVRVSPKSSQPLTHHGPIPGGCREELTVSASEPVRTPTLVPTEESDNHKGPKDNKRMWDIAGPTILSFGHMQDMFKLKTVAKDLIGNLRGAVHAGLPVGGPFEVHGGILSPSCARCIANTKAITQREEMTRRRLDAQRSPVRE